MTAWRMALRDGMGGPELWPICQKLGVAAIEYRGVDDIDLSKYLPGEPRSAWRQLAPSQQASLRRLVEKVATGDVIYVKQGPLIVGKGVVAGPYRFDRKNRIVGRHGTPWQHQRPVHWVPEFPETRVQIGVQQGVALVRLEQADVAAVEQAARRCYAELSDMEGTTHEAKVLMKKRSRKLRLHALDRANGVCSVCRRDFNRLLDGKGVRVLQVHHKKQLSSRTVPSETKSGDLAVVCANCHLLLHLNPTRPLSIEKLRKMLETDGAVECHK